MDLNDIKKSLEGTVRKYMPNRQSSVQSAGHTGTGRKVGGAAVRRQKEQRAKNAAGANTRKEVQDVLNFQGAVLTAPGGSLEGTKEQREVAAILENGTLVAHKDDRLNPYVTALVHAAEQNNFRVRKRVYTELSVIRRIYEQAERRNSKGQSLKNKSERQRDFMQIVTEAADLGSSDVHIDLGRYEAEIRVRSDGVVRFNGQRPAAEMAEILEAAFNMADSSDQSYKPMEYQMARVPETKAPLPEGVQALRLQFNPRPGGGRYMVARLLYSTAFGGGGIGGLGYAPLHIRQHRKMWRRSFGVVVIAGPTGSGKSTTLAGSLSMVIDAKSGMNVVTIEDPPEYIIPGAIQLPVTNAKTEEERNEKFREAITAVLRDDPDVVMIGEMRDGPSANLALTAAMTGHQVWTSLHANDGMSIIGRLADMGVDQTNLTDHTLVSGLIGQRLVRKLCPHCKIPLKEARSAKRDKVDLPDDTVQTIDKVIGQEYFDGIYCARTEGCEHCQFGYKGRTVAAETITPDPEFMKIIRTGDKIAAEDYWIKNLEGMTMLEHGAAKMVRGLVDPYDLEERVNPLTYFNRSRLEFALAAVDEEA